MSLLIRGAEVDGTIVDVACAAGRIVEIGRGLVRRAADELVDAGGGALIRGLHDHHLHLMSMAAAATSTNLAGLSAIDVEARLRAEAMARPKGEWIRAVGHHESTGGPLTRVRLDAIVPDHPIRVQHRSGHAWILNTAALSRVGRLGREGGGEHDGEHGGERGGERDGWVVDGDGELSATWQPAGIDLAGVGRRLSSFGITSVTDATPTNDIGHLATLAGATGSGVLPFRVTVMGGIGLVDATIPAPLGRGPVKLMVPDGEGVDLDALAASMALAHDAGRPVALHCVSAAAAAISLAAWDIAGAVPGDRLEHGAVLSEDVVGTLVTLGVAIVTQPGFVHDRGDHYLAAVDRDEVPVLYRCGTLFDAGIEVRGSSDAPFGPDDPWSAMRTAVDRRTRSGVVLGASERITPDRALAMWGGARPEVGAPADLCLLDCTLASALDDLVAAHVAATFVGGRNVALQM